MNVENYNNIDYNNNGASYEVPTDLAPMGEGAGPSTGLIAGVIAGIVALLGGGYAAFRKFRSRKGADEAPATAEAAATSCSRCATAPRSRFDRCPSSTATSTL